MLTIKSEREFRVYTYNKRVVGRYHNDYIPVRILDEMRIYHYIYNYNQLLEILFCDTILYIGSTWEDKTSSINIRIILCDDPEEEVSWWECELTDDSTSPEYRIATIIIYLYINTQQFNINILDSTI